MKTGLIVLVLISFLLLAGCDWEQASQSIGEVAGQAEYQLIDPNSDVQQAAEGLSGVVGSAVVLVQSVPGFPYAKIILGALSTISVLLNVIIGWRKKVVDTALKEVITGGQEFKKLIASKEAIADFKVAHDKAQSTNTKKMVAAIKIA